MTDAKTDSATPNHVRTWRWRWRWPIAIALIAVFLIFDIGPSVPPQVPPGADHANTARRVAQRTRAALGSGSRAWLSYSANELADAAVLASSLRDFGRFEIRLRPGSARFRASRPLLGPVWVNVSATVGDTKTGFPPVAIRVGRLPLGETVSRALIGLARRTLIGRGIKIPPLDSLVDGVAITATAVSANIYFPGAGRAGRRIAGLRTNPVDAAAAARVYCTLRALQRASPTDDFAQIVNRAFAIPTGLTDAVEGNRAAFVALAAYTAGPGVMRLSHGMQTRVAGCIGEWHAAPLLAGRADLPMHWSLSAALSVALGDDVSAAMGEWKELSDSRPDGSGFSFVDLAADRSGLAFAARAIDPARAAVTAARLRRATAQDIVPISALALSEGVTEAEFVSRYGSIDSDAFAKATARIDRVVGNTAPE